MFLVIVTTHILGLESLAVHLPAAASLSLSSSTSFGIPFYIQVMCLVIRECRRHDHRLDLLGLQSTVGGPGE